MLRLLLCVFALAPAGVATAQSANLNINDRPLVTATGTGEATRPPEFARLGFNVRGEGATATEALSSLSRQKAQVEAGLRSLRGIGHVDIISTQISTQDVRSPSCSPSQPYLAAQRLSVGECAVIGGIATMEIEVKVSPAAKAGDVASMASQLGAKSVGLRGSGFANEAALQNEAAEKAVADARREAELVARAAGGRLGQVLRIQDASFPAVYGLPPVQASVAESPAPPAPAPPPPPLAVPLSFTPQPVTRTARITVIYALEPGTAGH